MAQTNPQSLQSTATPQTTRRDIIPMAIAAEPGLAKEVGYGQSAIAEMAANPRMVSDYLNDLNPDMAFFTIGDGIYQTTPQIYETINSKEDAVAAVENFKALPLSTGLGAKLTSAVLPTVGGVGGGILGGLGVGAATVNPVGIGVGGVAGAGLGSGAGEAANQAIAAKAMKESLAKSNPTQSKGFERGDFDAGRIALNALMGAGGEGLGRILAPALRGASGMAAERLGVPNLTETIGEKAISKIAPVEIKPIGDQAVNINKLLYGTKGQIGGEVSKISKPIMKELEMLEDAAQYAGGKVNPKTGRVEVLPETLFDYMGPVNKKTGMPRVNQNTLNMIREIERNPELTAEQALDLITDANYVGNKVQAIKNRLTSGRTSGMSFEDVAGIKPRQLVFLKEMLAKRVPTMGLPTQDLGSLVGQLGDIQGSLGLALKHPVLKQELKQAASNYLAPANYSARGAELITAPGAQLGIQTQSRAGEDLKRALMNALSPSAK